MVLLEIFYRTIVYLRKYVKLYLRIFDFRKKSFKMLYLIFGERKHVIKYKMHKKSQKETNTSIIDVGVKLVSDFKFQYFALLHND